MMTTEKVDKTTKAHEDLVMVDEKIKLKVVSFFYYINVLDYELNFKLKLR